MGIENSTVSLTTNDNQETEEQFLAKLHYMQSVNKKQLGPFKIYRFQEPPYDYLMKQSRNFIKNDPAYTFTANTLAYIKKELCHKNISKLQYYKIDEKFNMCNKVYEISTYSNYYGITLKQVIQEHRHNDMRFTQNQIWYVLKVLCEVSIFLNEKSINYCGYLSNDIPISAEGYIKLFIFHLNQEISMSNFISTQKRSNDSSIKSVLYERSLQNRHNLWQFLPIPPEYLNSLKQGHHTPNIGHESSRINLLEKQQSFLIGMTIMQMLIDEDLRKYYNYNISSQQFCTFKRSSIKQDIHLLKNINPEISQILSQMLQANPSKRISPKDIIKYIQENQDQLTIGGSIRMFDDNGAQRKNKLSYKTSFDYQSSILKGIQQNLLQSKLTAGPIRTFTKKSGCNSVREAISKQEEKSSDHKYTSKKLSLNQSINIGVKSLANSGPNYRSMKSRSITSSTTNRVGQNFHDNLLARNKSNSLYQYSESQKSSMLSLNIGQSILDNSSPYKNGPKNNYYYDKDQTSNYYPQQQQNSLRGINVTKCMAQTAINKTIVGVSLASSKKSMDTFYKQSEKQSKIRMTSRRGSSLSIKM